MYSTNTEKTRRKKENHPRVGAPWGGGVVVLVRERSTLKRRDRAFF